MEHEPENIFDYFPEFAGAVVGLSVLWIILNALGMVP